MTDAVLLRPPAKLNLFLEILGRREDGFHEIDTVMVPIDWCDQLRLARTDAATVELSVRWLPSREVVANTLGVSAERAESSRLLDIPADETNLVHRALSRFRECFEIESGFACLLDKRIPAGAGMGGASSDAAAAIHAAAMLCGLDAESDALHQLAAEIGSDVPFFLGLPGTIRTTAARAQGRGEILQAVPMRGPLDFVVVFPGVSLSTGKVYANCQIPPSPRSAVAMIEALNDGRLDQLSDAMLNRLTEPAKKLAPRIAEILESLWQIGLRTCQLTGSGSACFAIAGSRREALRCTEQLRARLEPGAIVMAARSARVPALVNWT
jgi:4-diphosphocytidyl-2-C-methyl-D-erythritol kinase